MAGHLRWVAALVISCALVGDPSQASAQEASDSPRNEGREALALPVVPIAQVLEDRNGDTIPDRILQPAHVRGVVTIGSGVIADDRTQLYIQDSTGGIYLFSRRPHLPPVGPGDIVDVGGVIDQYRGSVQLVRPFYRVTGHTAVPQPIRTTVAELTAGRLYGRLVQVDGTIEGRQNQGTNLALQLKDRDKTIDLIFSPKVMRGMSFSDLPRGSRVTVTGVASIYSLDRPYREGFRLLIPRPDAVQVRSRPMPVWLRNALIAVLVGVIAIGLAAYVALLIRRSAVKRRRQIAVLNDVSATVARSGSDIDALLSSAVGVLLRHNMISGAVVHLMQADQLQLRGSFGIDTLEAREIDQQVQSRLSTALVRQDSGKPLALPQLHPLLCIPLHGRSRTVGVLTAFTDKRHTPTPDEAATIAAAANVIALGAENIQVFEEAEQQQNELKQLAITDPLTGLYNRRFLDEYLRIHIPMARRQSAPVSFIAIDLDNFKKVNDTHGHDAGDELLREFGATVRRLTRASDLPVRLGGEEFLVVMADTNEAGAVSFASRLQAAIRESAFGAGIPAGFSLTASIGIALYPDHGENVAQLLRVADESLYESKRAGRDRVTVAPMPFRIDDSANLA